MTMKVVAWAWRQVVASPLQKLALVLLADEADNLGIATVEYEDLAALCCCPQGAFEDAVAQLAKRGLLTITHDAGRNYLRGISLNLEVESIASP